MFMKHTPHSNTTAYVYPGACIGDIEARVKVMREPGKKLCLVINVGSNYIFRKNVASQDVLEKHWELTSSIKDRFCNIVIVIALPHNHKSLAFNINKKDQQVCNDAKIGFMIPG